MNLQTLLGIELPIIQAPMAGVQGSALAIAVSAAGRLGSLPCAMLTPQAMRTELEALRAGTAYPYNVNFFCHEPPTPDVAAEAAWRTLLVPCYTKFGLGPVQGPAGPERAPFSDEAADVLADFHPPVVSFHFGLPSPRLLGRIHSWGTRVPASATTVGEARGSSPVASLPLSRKDWKPAGIAACFSQPTSPPRSAPSPCCRRWCVQ